jgi:hypothetical protein
MVKIAFDARRLPGSMTSGRRALGTPAPLKSDAGITWDFNV